MYACATMSKTLFYRGWKSVELKCGRLNPSSRRGFGKPTPPRLPMMEALSWVHLHKSQISVVNHFEIETGLVESNLGQEGVFFPTLYTFFSAWRLAREHRNRVRPLYFPQDGKQTSNGEESSLRYL